eukprot:7474398-Karenia_brevis.AAC.1
MLPQEFQDKLYDLGSNERDLEYGKVKEYILSLAQQRIHMGLPRPADVNEIQNESQCAIGNVANVQKPLVAVERIVENGIYAAFWVKGRGQLHLQCGIRIK